MNRNDKCFKLIFKNNIANISIVAITYETSYVIIKIILYSQDWIGPFFFFFFSRTPLPPLLFFYLLAFFLIEHISLSTSNFAVLHMYILFIQLNLTRVQDFLCISNCVSSFFSHFHVFKALVMYLTYLKNVIFNTIYLILVTSSHVKTYLLP